MGKLLERLFVPGSPPCTQKTFTFVLNMNLTGKIQIFKELDLAYSFPHLKGK